MCSAMAIYIIFIGMLVLVPTLAQNNCTTCAPGWGVVSLCSDELDTECTPCELTVEVSESVPHLKSCRLCAECGEGEVVEHACNVTHDTQCACARGKFRGSDGICVPCEPCPHGWGAVRPCSEYHDAECSQCPPGTHRSVPTVTLACDPCTICRDDQETVKNCTPIQDTICTDLETPRMLRKPIPRPAFSDSAVTSDTHAADRTILLLYCFGLGGLVLGLLGYAVFKRRQAGHQARKLQDVGGATTLLSPAQSQTECHYTLPTEYLSLDSLLRDVSSSRRREAELLLSANSPRKDWKALARELGYSDSRITSFESRGRERHGGPVRQMFADWSRRENSTLRTVVRALQSLGRHDVIATLLPPSQPLVVCRTTQHWVKCPECV